MKKVLLGAAALLWAVPALAQVQQSGTVTARHPAYWVTSGAIGDPGGATDSALSSLGVTNEGGPGLCVSSQRASAAGRQQLCLSTGTSTGATISLTNLGTAPSAPLSFVIDGTTYPFPGSLANITIGVTPVVGGTNSQCLFVSGGNVGQQACTLSAITSLIGDATATGPGISTITFGNVNGTPGTFGSGALVPIITVNAKGLVTNVSTAPFGITVGSSTITSGINNGLLYDNGGLLGNLSTQANGVLTTTGAGAPLIATALPSGLTIPSPTFTGTETFPDAATWTSTGITKAVAISVGSATLPASGNISISGLYMVNGTQIAASNLSNGTTGSGAVVLAAAPAISGTWTGSPTFSGTITFSGPDVNTGTSPPASAGGQVYVMGTIAAPTLANTGQGAIYDTVVGGLSVQGDGSTSDFTLANKSGATVATVPTGTTKLNFPSLSSGTCSSGLGLDSGNNTVLVSCPGAASSIQVGTTTINSATGNNYILTTGTGTLANIQPQGGLTSNATVLLPPPGFVNALRNASLTSWFHGTSGTVTTAANQNNWTAEGVFVVPTGASVTWSQQATASCPTGNPTYNCVKVIGASSVTDVKIRFVIESYQAAKLAGKTVTFQILWLNNSGSSITPTLMTAFPTTQDGGVTFTAGWAAQTTDLAATSMQACTNGSSCTESYTLAVSSSATAGYEFVVDFGNNFGAGANTMTLGGGFDARVTPGVATGTNANPPTPEIRDAESDTHWNQRFYSSSYENGVAAGASTHIGMQGGAIATAAIDGISTVIFPATLRASPSGALSYWDGAGNASKASTITNSASSVTFTDNVSMATTAGPPFNIGTKSFLFGVGTTSLVSYFLHYTADVSIWGG